MRQEGKRILASVCVAVMLFCLPLCGCKKKIFIDTAEQSRVESQKKITNLLDDFFAYVKMGRIDKIGALVDEPGPAIEKLQALMDSSRKDACSAVCSLVSAQIQDVYVDGNEGYATILLSYPDLERAHPEEGDTPFSSEKELKDAILRSQSLSVSMRLKLVEKEKWLLSSDALETIYSTVFAYLETEDLVVTEPSDTKPPYDPDISVFDSYYVDPKGDVIGGYTKDTSKICLYIFTWNTYSNLSVTYQFEDETGTLLYENSYVVQNNSDWIPCSWRPSAPLTTGRIFCNVYSPSGKLFLTKEIGIYEDEVSIPFPVEMDSCSWCAEDGTDVLSYMDDAQYVEFVFNAMKFYDDLILNFRIEDEEGGVLFEGVFDEGGATNTFRFIWDKDVDIKGKTKLSIYVTTEKGNPFWQADISVLPVPEEEEE
ncbi:MAG: hypothetical protein J6Y08_00675 [Clostridiales bacterium]|nr:hypothetical protein [Clostridiales bacterium]